MLSPSFTVMVVSTVVVSAAGALCDAGDEIRCPAHHVDPWQIGRRDLGERHAVEQECGVVDAQRHRRHLLELVDPEGPRHDAEAYLEFQESLDIPSRSRAGHRVVGHDSEDLTQGHSGVGFEFDGPRQSHGRSLPSGCG